VSPVWFCSSLTFLSCCSVQSLHFFSSEVSILFFAYIFSVFAKTFAVFLFCDLFQAFCKCLLERF
jgi:hypothetical protein